MEDIRHSAFKPTYFIHADKIRYVNFVLNVLPPACKVLILIGSFAKPVDGSIGSRWKRDLLQPSQLRARKSSEISIKEIENFRPLWQGWDARRLRFRERKKEWRKKIFRQEHEEYINNVKYQWLINKLGRKAWVNFEWNKLRRYEDEIVQFRRPMTEVTRRVKPASGRLI
ncbi:hypothetical protein V1477_007330 [Vespula maculifrons]|uniref:Uncharacterized protein n=1 Tax=Vespula maculifrons TaxID=7453 RepID=A0ABD2CI71_VESMC